MIGFGLHLSMIICLLEMKNHCNIKCTLFLFPSAIQLQYPDEISMCPYKSQGQVSKRLFMANRVYLPCKWTGPYCQMQDKPEIGVRPVFGHVDKARFCCPQALGI